MDFIKKIREEILKKNQYQMHKELGFYNVRSYQSFENTKESLNAKKLISLWHLSGLDGNEFLKMIEEDVNTNTKPERVRRSKRKLPNATHTTAKKPSPK